MIVCFLHAKVGHCQAIYTQTPPHENDGVFLFLLPESYIVTSLDYANVHAR